jgi:hypothetical protein
MSQRLPDARRQPPVEVVEHEAPLSQPDAGVPSADLAAGACADVEGGARSAQPSARPAVDWRRS